MRAVERAKDPVDFAVLLEDSAALLGLVVAAAGVALGHLTGQPAYDGVASLVIAAILGATAFLLARESKGLLIGEAANREVLAAIRKIGQQRPGVECVEDVLTMHVGPDFILVALRVALAPAAWCRAPDVFDDLEREIRRAEPRVRRVFIDTPHDGDSRLTAARSPGPRSSRDPAP
jgi:divalent metal cation (Fe/Co/Zn/Cd) transporter